MSKRILALCLTLLTQTISMGFAHKFLVTFAFASLLLLLRFAQGADTRGAYSPSHVFHVVTLIL